jgi:choline dehydrogenase-like flavoprotein
MNDGKYDYIVVGSGAGGATAARELSRKNKRILITEIGKPEENIGTYRDSTRYYDAHGVGIFKVPKMSREGAVIWHSMMAGGSTVVSCGNGVRCLEKELAEMGINIGDELAEAEKELRVAPIAERLLSDGSREIMRASKELGYTMQFMPKFIDSKACRKCGQCVLGCPNNAKWTALEYLKEAEANGADTRYGTRCLSVIIENGRAKGIVTTGPNGREKIMADVVIISAGGLGTPVILQNSGLKQAGEGLFIDLVVNTYGTTDGLNLVHEPTMTLVNHDFHQEKGFILSPMVNHPWLVRAFEMRYRVLTTRDRKIIGIMTKICDESTGKVYPDGSVSKAVTAKDKEKLEDGSKISKEILLKAGVKKIFVSRVQGGHPGGTAAIGKIVDTNLQTEVNNLFVCDASVLPKAPGLPPILTIVALAKRLAKTLTGEM